MKRNMNQIIESTKIEWRYDMRQDEMQELISSIHSKDDLYSAIVRAFKFGFGQGRKFQKNKGR